MACTLYPFYLCLPPRGPNRQVAWDPVHGGVFRGLSVHGHKFMIDADVRILSDSKNIPNIPNNRHPFPLHHATRTFGLGAMLPGSTVV